MVAVLLSGGIAVLVVLFVRYLRLKREVDAVVERLRLGSHEGPSTLYRGVREMERALEQTTQDVARLRVAVDRAEVGIVIADRRGAILFTNPAADAVMQGRLGDTVARTRVAQMIDRVTQTGAGEELEFDLYTPVRRILNLSALPLPSSDGRGHAALVYIVDLTDRHQVDAMRRDFVANAGHELKTPLGALSVLAETLAITDDPKTRKRLAERLISESTRMARLVDDILTLSSVESLETPHTPVRVADVLRDAESTVAVNAAERNVSLEAKLPPDDLVVAGDRKQLVSAVGNLLDNAIKYTLVDPEAGGTVWYRAWQEGDAVFIEVEDHGIGIADQHLERVFERFYRVDRARSRASGGTGLGLAIVRNVARTHGGDISVRSELGVGSTFTIELPVLKE